MWLEEVNGGGKGTYAILSIIKILKLIFLIFKNIFSYSTDIYLILLGVILEDVFKFLK